MLEKFKHYYCHQIGSQVIAIEMAPLRMFYFMTLTYILKIMNMKCEYLENNETSEKCSSMIFIEANICHRMGLLQIFCNPWPWPSFSRSNIFLLCICSKKITVRQWLIRQICLDLHGPCHEVALVVITPCLARGASHIRRRFCLQLGALLGSLSTFKGDSVVLGNCHWQWCLLVERDSWRHTWFHVSFFVIDIVHRMCDLRVVVQLCGFVRITLALYFCIVWH